VEACDSVGVLVAAYRLACDDVVVFAASYPGTAADWRCISRASCIVRGASVRKNSQIVSLNCLIVDDSPEFLVSATRLLQAEGASVVGTAGTGHEALELASALEPDVVLVDVELGDEDGVQVAASLTTLPSAPVVILISTRDRLELRELMRPGQAAGFLTKDSLSLEAIRGLMR